MDKLDKAHSGKPRKQTAEMETATGCGAKQPANVVGEQRDVADELIELSRAVQGIHARVAERHGLTPIQAKLLFVLIFGPRVMGNLAATFGVEKAALTGLVDRVERLGLVKRSPVPGDRRAYHVTLTDAGQRAATAFYADAKGELNMLLSRLAPHDREQFHSALTTINSEKDEG
jgi:DNA-binding MarR family transcriptional regulator